MTATPRKRQPIDAFIAKKADIDEMLTRLTELSDDHFHVHPDEVTSRPVGTLGHRSPFVHDGRAHRAESAEIAAGGRQRHSSRFERPSPLPSFRSPQ